MNLKSLKSRLNIEKNRQIKGKIIKSSMIFNENKPDFENIKIAISSYKTGIYEFSPAWRSKKQTQSKPNSKPICYNAIIGLSSFLTSKYVRLGTMPGKKQTQTKPKQTQSQNAHPAGQIKLLLFFLC
jgi:hypothetical protein